MKVFPIALLIALAVALAADLPPAQLIQPKELAARLSADGAKPLVIQVGPNLLYRSKHIRGSLFAGPGSKAEGLELLKSAVANVAKDREIVLYCGCCPWGNCPNINPAIVLLKELGFVRVKAAYMKENFKADWVDQGYPVEP